MFYFNHIELPNKQIDGLATVVVRFQDKFDAKTIRAKLKEELQAQGDMFIEDENEQLYPDIIENTYTCKGVLSGHESLAEVKGTEYSFLYGYGYNANRDSLKWRLTNITITATESEKECSIYYQGIYATIQNHVSE